MLGELAEDDTIILCDMEAGVGTLLRMQPGDVDLVLVIAEATAKSLDVARRAAEIATERSSVLIVGNRVRDEEDAERIRTVFSGRELVLIPEDPAIHEAEREGRAPIDVDPGAPGVRAIIGIANRLA
ncbi:MAG: hypothetical protein H0V45_08445 [Actinobacteria bacterium]|nr:hypothetical protein [Actinomycetota bacterium]